ncbi:Transcriptional regulator, contains XRE-family HTH domain [Haloechinothrix alba]|uniref:Transcriptional regulator, contains XRE-family HTH domain n=1 Tax=Haloechinothrix alba TaxID=664784 RepID=A0A238XTL3_9PSEU|nr:helix-turn-helix transcriptional regulator [Haloechinothrix alba]SNR62396.1 Transcriptional regulator, contains XRE-family HTH domain [Haloechinothrix alba]
MKRETVRLTIGERIAWYRRRRGLSQRVLADLIGRTEDWLNKVENNRIQLDRLSVINVIAWELDVTLGDLLAEPSLVEWSPETPRKTVPALRDALLTYRQLIPGRSTDRELQTPDVLLSRVSAVWDAYQASRFGYMTASLSGLIEDLAYAVDQYEGQEKVRCQRLLALTYQASTAVLTKLSETDLACVAAQRGYDLAEQAEERVVLASLTRSVCHALLSTGRYSDAVGLISDAPRNLGGLTSDSSRAYVSVYGTMYLTGAMAAARADDRAVTREFLQQADTAAQRIGRDDNLMWTAFGPTNVAIHKVSTAMELGNIQQALDLGPRVDPTPLPTERQVRHHLEVARAHSAVSDRDAALGLILEAEQSAPEQVRHHSLSRDLVLTWMRRAKGALGDDLTGLASRLNVA